MEVRCPIIAGVLATALAVIATSSHALDYFVATDGSDTNDGLSVASPWRTFSTAANRIGDGDTLWVRGGTYRGKTSFTNASGTDGQPIRIFAYSNEVPVLTGSMLAENWQFFTNDVWYVDGWPVNSQQVFKDGELLQQLGWPNDYMAQRACSCTDWYYIPHGFSCADIDATTRSLDIGDPLTNMPPGSFYYHEGTGRLYTRLAGGADPNGHVMEASTDLGIFYDDAVAGHVHLKGLSFQHASTMSYIKGGWPGVLMNDNGLIEDCTITWCDASGLTMRNNAAALDCDVSNNGMLGIVCNAFTNVLVRGCTVYSNNYREFRGTFAGGVRFIPNAGAIVEDNEVAYNRCTGIWFDTCVGGHPITVRNNYVHHNWIAPRRPGDTVNASCVGIYIEFTENAHVYNNIVVSNANIGIHLSASRNTRVENNLIMATMDIPGGHRALGSLIMDNPQPAYPVHSNLVANNIFDDNLTDYDIIATVSNGTTVIGNVVGNNVYYRSHGAGTTFPASPFSAAYLGRGIYSSLGAWQAATGWDGDSVTNNPQLDAGFALMPGSPVIDRGVVTLETDVDYAGNPRPTDGDYDGAAAVDPGPFESASTGRVHYVDHASTNPVAPFLTRDSAGTSLSDVVAVASNGALILVAAGTYGISSPLLVDRAVALKSADGKTATVLDGGHTSACLNVTASGALIDGFTIRSGWSAGDGGGVWLGPGATMQNCVVSNSVSGGRGGGVYLSSGGIVRNTLIAGCRSVLGGGLYAEGGSTVKLNRVEGNTSDSGGGMMAEGGALVEEFVFADNASAGHGAGLYAGPGARVSRCTFVANVSSNGCGGGVYLAAGAAVEHSTFSGNGAVDGAGIYATSSNRIDYVEVEDGTASRHGGGVYASNGASVSRLVAVGNAAGSGNGGAVFAGPYTDLLNVLAYENLSGSFGGGLYLDDFAQADFATVTDNESGTGGGVYLAASNTVLENSIVWSNRASIGGNWSSTNGATIRHVLSQPVPTGVGNTGGDPAFADPGAEDYQLLAHSSALDAADPATAVTNDIEDASRASDGNADHVVAADIGAFESHRIRYVDQSSPSPAKPYLTWATAAHMPQDAVNAASAGDLVLVETGVYHMAAVLNVSKGITIRSLHGADETRLDGGSARRVLYLNHADALVEGFTIQNGRVDAGGGGYLAKGKLSRCILKGNVSTNNMGGAFDYGAIPGPYYCQLIYDSFVHEGGGGAVLIGDAEMENCLVFSNSAAYGGGTLGLDGGRLRFSTVSANAAGTGGGLYAKGMDSVQDTILYANASGGDYFSEGPTAVWENVTADPLPPGAGSSDADPLFLSAAAADFRLSAGSPAIDSAAATDMPGVALDGVPRPLDGDIDGNAAPDRGAYEYVHPDADSDGDGLSDTNESASGTSPVRYDTDGDGMGDGEEVIAGTSGLDDKDYFSVRQMLVSNGTFKVTWPGRTGRMYTVYATTNMFESFEVLTNLLADPPADYYLEPAAPGQRYYILDVSVP